MYKNKYFIYILLSFILVCPSVSTAKNKMLLDTAVILPIGANLKILESRINEFVPDILADINQPNKVCVKSEWLKTKSIPRCGMKGIKIYCKDQWLKTIIIPEVKCDLKGWVKRDGRISVSGQGSTLKFAFPIKAHMSAKAGIRESADAAATIYVNVTPRIHSDWSISLDIAPNYRWSKRPHLKLFYLMKLTFGRKIEPTLQNRMNEFVAELRKVLSEMNIGGKVKSV